MLLKRSKENQESSSNGSVTATIVGRGTGMRMTMATASTMTPRIQRKGFRTPSKRYPGKTLPGKLHSTSRMGPGKIPPGKRLPQRPHPPPCDNSNDSGFGFDQHVEVQQNNGNNNSSSNNQHHHNHQQQQQQQLATQPLIRTIPSSRLTNVTIDDRHEQIDTDDPGIDDSDDYYQNNTTQIVNVKKNKSNENCENVVKLKRRKTEIRFELDNDDACSEDEFIRKIATGTFKSRNVVNNEDSMPEVVEPIPPTPQQASSSSTTNKPSQSSSLLSSPPSSPSFSSQQSTKLMSNTNRTATRVAHKRQPSTTLNNVAASSNGRVQLEIISQPEQQHRARYQTEGSRGAVKDRSGNSFPIVRLVGYNKPATLEVFIGTDIGRIGSHMFYQACKVAGKNSTQCNEKVAEDGTMVIEIDFKPENDMTITCDCVGILKERNVDVEHRFPDHLGQKNKKKSTRCRMVFRTKLAHDDGTIETLQVCSNPIICTQPPGVPEICKKSLNSCPADGGLELFIIGKNFLKDTRVLFQETYIDNDGSGGGSGNGEIKQASSHQKCGTVWEQSVLPDKEYLQQNHLVCIVPPYLHQNIRKPVTVQLSIISSGKRSEWHTFIYTPKGSYTTLSAAATLSTLHGTLSAQQDSNFMDTSISPDSLVTGIVRGGVGGGSADVVGLQPNSANTLWNGTTTNGINSGVETKHEIDSDMMPPPITTQIPMIVRRPSISNAMITDQIVQITGLKTEILDDNSQNSFVDVMQPESMDRFPAGVQQQQQQHTQITNGTPMMDTAPNSSLKEVSANYQYHQERFRKHSIDMLDMRSMSILNDQSNTMSGFSTAAAAAASATSQMGAAAAAAVEMAANNEQQMATMFNVPAAAVQQNQETVEKFLSSLDTTMSVKSNDVTVTEQRNMFDGVNRSPPNDSSSQVVFPTMQDVVTNVSIDQTITDILQHARAAAAAAANTGTGGGISMHDQVGVHIRRTSISSNSSSSPASSSSSSSSSSPSPPSASMSSPNVAAKSINSPISHDVILNSETAGINSLNMRQIIQSTGEHVPSSDNLTTDIILNPSVAPGSILCSADGTTSNLISHQVSMSDTLLNGISMPNQPLQDTATALTINDIIMDTASTANTALSSNVQAQLQQTTAHDPEVTAASTAVSNMIIKAAADLISIQENSRNQVHEINPESMLISLNPTIAPGSQSQLLVSGGGAGVVVGAAAAAVNNTSSLSEITAANTSPICNHHPQPFLTRHRSMIDTSHAKEVEASTVNAASVTDPLVNILLNRAEVHVQQAHAAVAAAAAAGVSGVQVQYPMGMQLNGSSSTKQESLMAALTGNDIPKSVIVSAQQQQQEHTINGILTPNVIASATVPLPPSIPQELTQMSDQDLISYINPSTFDQI